MCQGGLNRPSQQPRLHHRRWPRQEGAQALDLGLGQPIEIALSPPYERLGPSTRPSLTEILQQLGIMGLVARCQQRPAHRMQTGVAARAVVDRQVVLGQIVGAGDPSQVAGEVAQPLARS